jgi:hypothetical protein
MDVVAHNAKIMDLEAELLFCPLYSVEKERFHGITIEDQLLPICPGGNMIGDIGLKHSISAHTGYYGDKPENALADLCGFRKFLALSPVIVPRR